MSIEKSRGLQEMKNKKGKHPSEIGKINIDNF